MGRAAVARAGVDLLDEPVRVKIDRREVAAERVLAGTEQMDDPLLALRIELDEPVVSVVTIMAHL